jgi:hypothetical protein
MAKTALSVLAVSIFALLFASCGSGGPQLSEDQQRVRTEYIRSTCPLLKSQVGEFDPDPRNALISADGYVWQFFGQARELGLLPFEIEDAVRGACPEGVANTLRIAKLECANATFNQQARCAFAQTEGLVPAEYATKPTK